MRPWRGLPVATATCVAAVGPATAWSYSSDYTYVRMSLTVPWTLYFVFLAGVLIPFVVMIVLAWRGAAPRKPPPIDAADAEPAGGDGP